MFDFIVTDPDLFIRADLGLSFAALAIFSAATNVIFGISSGNQQRRAREQEAAVARENARRQADRMLAEDLPQMGASQRAAWAKSGFQVEGTPFAMMMDTARRMARDAADVRRTGNVQAEYISRQGRVERQGMIAQGIMGAMNTGLQALGQKESMARFKGEKTAGSNS